MRLIAILILFLGVFSGLGAMSTPIVECESWDKARANDVTPGKRYFAVDEALPAPLASWSNATREGGGRQTIVLRERPHVGVALDAGWLIGINHGEWGGALVYRSDEQEVVILWDNIYDLFRMDDHFIVTAGLSHMGLNRGAIYAVYRDGPGEFRSEKLHELPGAPAMFRLQESGHFYVDVQQAGEYVLSPEHELKEVRCD